MSNLVYVAVKEMVLRNDWAKSQWFRTIKIWMRLKHENIVPLLGVTDGFGSVPALVLPWLGNGALTGYLQRKHEMLSYSQKFAMLSDVARGLQYLHSESIVHGDLTGNNVLVDTNGKALLTDFSLFASLPDRISQALLPTNPGGTVCYMAPECLTVDDEGDQTSVLSPASDVYSFGGIMLQVVEGNVPYYYIRTQAAIINYIARGIHPRRPPTSVISDADWDFIQMCWLGDMNRRPTTKDIVAFVEGRAEVQS
ncbi:kinase-like domain-containing protein [Suillus subalutaceus]|uniref:kinase-like domain-containing protein n=1 Tax=Suillus subalutaceus TaxID=48586 RepID=UPI001B87572C|nr:kinase-like domain-containing protein [Suillus subalutaceus]KAG1828752.1 kinase-like domain-containing protein [Suillus subalutaceus]